MQREISEDEKKATEAERIAQEQNDFILEKQKIQLGCDEMQRITDDIIVPSFLKAAKALKNHREQVEVVLMDCESPIDAELYNVGVRCTIGELEKEPESKFMLIADPSAFDFTFTLINQKEEEQEEILHFHEVIPSSVEKAIGRFLSENYPEVEFEADSESSVSEKPEPPFRVQYDDGNEVSDVASTDTVSEALKMAATFAIMFKTEEAITILDANDTIIC